MTLTYRVVPPEENLEYLQEWPQVQVYEGSYQPEKLAPMIKFATNELLNMMYRRVRDMIGNMPKDGYECEPDDLDYQGHEPASWPNSSVTRAHNVKIRAVPISSCFRPLAKQWVACHPESEREVSHRGLMAGPRYHRYLSTTEYETKLDETQGATKLRGNGYSIIVETRGKEYGSYHRLLLSQQHALESLKHGLSPPQSAFWTGYHWHVDEHHNAYLTIINFDFTLLPISRTPPHFVPVARTGV